MATTCVMVVSDDPLVWLDLREQLRRLDYVVIGEAGGAQAALWMARQTQPDLILIDSLSDAAGSAMALAELMVRRQLAPVLLLGATSDPALARRAAEVGVMAYLPKPCSDDSMRAAIEIALVRYRDFQALARETNDLREQVAALRTLEQAKAVLMQQYNLTDSEATRRIHKASSDIHLPIGSIAEAILQTQDGAVY